MHKTENLLLCILDGWGMSSDVNHNGIVVANNWRRFTETYPMTTLEASEQYVGLPKGQMGNSEVGHMSIGLGRVILQDLPRIDQAIVDGSLRSNPKVKNLIETLKVTKGTCHLLGLLSPGGVHSHQAHIMEVAKILADADIPVLIHAFLDGRDTPPQSALEYYRDFQSCLNDKIKVATIGGRYFAMDRDKRWERVQKGYDAIVDAHSDNVFAEGLEGIEYFYTQGITDEFIPPFCIEGYQGMQDGDGLWMVNFRADRVRQILSALLQDNFEGFPRAQKVNFSATLGMSEYADYLTPLIPPIFEKVPLNNGLGELISKAGQKQLRIAETEKYAHVTFFFNGGREQPFEGEERILIPSPKVATYDLDPGMSAEEVTAHVIEAMHQKQQQLIVVNYANPDMVGHTGVIDAIEKAIRIVDNCLGRLEETALAEDWTVIITADHGNAEQMVDEGIPHTAHTCNPVPFLLISKNELLKLKKERGALSDVAPSILELLGYQKPKEMTGSSLIEVL